MTHKLSFRLSEGEGRRDSLTIMPDLLAGERDFRLHEPLHVVADIRREEFGIFIEVAVKGQLYIQCSRCAAEFAYDVNTAHSIILTPAHDTWEMDDETEQMHVIDLVSSQVDVLELVRQLLVESIPVKPLCREDCKGLCVMCGQDLNVAQCACENKFVDPRLAKLKDLFKDLSKER